MAGAVESVKAFHSANAGVGRPIIQTKLFGTQPH